MNLLSLTAFQACYVANELTRLGEVGELARLSTTLFDSKVDLNPHQVEAALFALSNPLQRGVILADEVGLGKTIEAGLVLCQRWAERRRRLIVVCPAHIRKQWQTELAEKFNLPSIVMDRRVWTNARRAGSPNPFDSDAILVISYGFAARMKDDLRAVPFDLVVMDEAHKLRNAYQPSRKGGQAVRWAFELRQKLLLTATPLQNTLLELYGLGWLIDEHIFGDRSAFQSRYCSAGGDLVGLRTRLAQFCKRTLRRDCTYVNYTRRQAMTHPFPQTDEERAIHRDVMSFVTREFSFSLPQRQRQLIEMILFKTLASSPQALAGTLRTIRQRLIDLRDGLSQEESARFIEALAADEDLDADTFAEEFEDLDWLDPDGAQPPPDGRALAIELAEVDALIARAERLNGDSKSVALIEALRAAFSKLEDVGALRKALIFTESRRTQDFLAEFLEANGYAGRVVTFNGSNSHPRAKAAYERFMQKHAGSDKVTGSKAVDIRTALIEEFRERGEILLATEAAAEGVNLQFCSLVVNYDLPWNPQRIEQRIGRCHRYGQKHDVVVVNFLSQDNVADKRVHDLLQQKFSLFDGLFGASDEVLGAIEDGIDFERRILAILKNCRTDGEIEAAFNALQLELEETISAKMTQARQQLLDHFDADVHERLKVRGEEAKLALDRVGERFWKLAHWGLDDARRAHNAIPNGDERPEHPTPKPLDVFTIPMDQHTRPGEICYEPFAGSGSQLIAAEKLGRRCFGIEISPTYCDLIIRRYIAFAGEGAVDPSIAKRYRLTDRVSASASTKQTARGAAQIVETKPTASTNSESKRASMSSSKSRSTPRSTSPSTPQPMPQSKPTSKPRTKATSKPVAMPRQAVTGKPAAGRSAKPASRTPSTKGGR